MIGIIFNRDATIDNRSFRRNEFAEVAEAKARRLTSDGTARYASGRQPRASGRQAEVRIIDHPGAHARGVGPMTETRG